MVYESDFYTTRRPYTRPTITSYSVTRREVPWHKVPTVPRPSQIPLPFTVYGSKQTPVSLDVNSGNTTRSTTEVPVYQHSIPYIAHKKLALVTPSAHGWRVNKSVLLGEIDRIYHKVRPSLAYQPTEDYLNSRAIVSFDDETRSIRAQTADLLKKIYTPIPRAQRPLPLAGDAYYSHSELPITDRITSDHYIDRLLAGPRDVHSNVHTMSFYDEPAKRYTGIGKGHLACVSFAGGRPFSRRKNLASTHDNIRNDINVLSHYGRFRAAAAAANVHDSDYIAPIYRAPTKSAVTGSWKSNAPQRISSDKSKDSHRSRELTAGAEFDAAMERKRKRKEALEAAAMKELQEEKRHKQREEDLSKLAAIEKEEEERKHKEEEKKLETERLEAERKAQKEAEKKAREEEEERKAKEEADRKAQKEAEKKAREEEEERKVKEEAEKKAEEEKRRKEEEERLAREEAERKAKEEEERKAREEAERLAMEEEERKKREEEERRMREEEERKAKEEAERLAREEEERKAKEEEERLVKEEAERIAREEEERLVAEAAAEKTEEEAEKEAESEAVPEEPAEEEEEEEEEKVAEPAEAPVEEPPSAEPEEEQVESTEPIEPANDMAEEEAEEQEEE